MILLLLLIPLLCSAMRAFILVRMEPVLFLQEGLDVEDSEVPAQAGPLTTGGSGFVLKA